MCVCYLASLPSRLSLNCFKLYNMYILLSYSNIPDACAELQRVCDNGGHERHFAARRHQLVGGAGAYLQAKIKISSN